MNFGDDKTDFEMFWSQGRERYVLFQVPVLPSILGFLQLGRSCEFLISSGIVRTGWSALAASYNDITFVLVFK